MPAQLFIVAMATHIPGPLAAERLAQAGHRVVKIEPPQGDPLEAAAPRWYARIVAGLDVRRLELKRPRARDELAKLLDDADVLITTIRPAALARLELDPEHVTQRYPRLCHLAITGESGDRADSAGHDLTYQARSGLLSPPTMPRTVYADLFAAERAVAAIYEMLYERERTQSGASMQLAIADGAEALSDPLRFGLTSAQGPLGGGSPHYRMYRASDGWIAFAALEPHFQANFKRATGADPFDAPALEAIFAQRSCAQWEALAQMHDLPLAAVRNG